MKNQELSKTALQLGPKAEAVRWALQKYFLPSLGVGAGIAGLANLAAQGRETARDLQEEPQAPKVVEIPQKVAQSPTDYLWKDSLILGGIGGGLGLGYYGMDAAMRKMRQKDLQARVDQAKREYYDLLTGKVQPKPVTPEVKDVPPQTNDKLAALQTPMAYPVIHGLLSSVVGEDMQKDAGWDVLTSMPVALGLLSATASHAFTLDRMREMDRRLKAEKGDKGLPKIHTPGIRIVSEAKPTPTVTQVKPMQKDKLPATQALADPTKDPAAAGAAGHSVPNTEPGERKLDV